MPKKKTTKKPSPAKALERAKRAKAKSEEKLERAVRAAKSLRRQLREAKAKPKKRNPGRPPAKWWESCLASVSAQRHAKDPAAVCNAAWFKQSPAERARIVRKLERGTSRQRRAAVAIARAERAHHGRKKNTGKPAKAKKGKRPRATRRELVRLRFRNPGRELVQVVYREQKPGDDQPYEYEHDFEGELPQLDMRGGRLRVRGGTYTTRNGWIHG